MFPQFIIWNMHSTLSHNLWSPRCDLSYLQSSLILRDIKSKKKKHPYLIFLIFLHLDFYSLIWAPQPVKFHIFVLMNSEKMWKTKNSLIPFFWTFYTLVTLNSWFQPVNLFEKLFLFLKFSWGPGAAKSYIIERDPLIY